MLRPKVQPIPKTYSLRSKDPRQGGHILVVMSMACSPLPSSSSSDTISSSCPPRSDLPGDEKRLSSGSMPCSSRTPESGTVTPVFLRARSAKAMIPFIAQSRLDGECRVQRTAPPRPIRRYARPGSRGAAPAMLGGRVPSRLVLSRAIPEETKAGQKRTRGNRRGSNRVEDIRGRDKRDRLGRMRGAGRHVNYVQSNGATRCCCLLGPGGQARVGCRVSRCAGPLQRSTAAEPLQCCAALLRFCWPQLACLADI